MRKIKKPKAKPRVRAYGTTDSLFHPVDLFKATELTFNELREAIKDNRFVTISITIN